MSKGSDRVFTQFVVQNNPAADFAIGESVVFSNPVITAAGFIRFIHLASSALLFGSLAFYLLVSHPALRIAGGENSSEFAAFSRRQLCLARWTLLAVFASGLLAFWLQIVSVSGVSLIQGLNPKVIAEVLVGTRYGLVWLVRMILMLLLAIPLCFRDRQQPHLRTLDLFLAAALVTAPVFAGHAAAGEGAWLLAQLTMDGLHLLAASLWLGGLGAFGFFLVW